MDGKDRQGTYNFFLTTTWGQPGAGHRAPCHPAGAAHGESTSVAQTFLTKEPWSINNQQLRYP